MKIAIATDTNSSITQKQADEHGIHLSEYFPRILLVDPVKAVKMRYPGVPS